jgi:hypothetical protein
MTTYRNIHGRSIQAVTTDPSESVAEGQIWYNTTSDTFKSVVSSEAFSNAAPMITGRQQSGNFGLQTAAVATSGYTTTRVTNTEEYNGSGWTASTAYPTALNELSGTGTETAGLVMGGRSPPPAAVTTTSEYDGSSWTAGGALPAGRHSAMAAGTQTAGLFALGRTQSGSPQYHANSYEYNGSSWTAGNSASTARAYLGGFGVQTSALAFGGLNPAISSGAQLANTEEYDGTNWTSGGDLGTARYQFLTTAGTSNSDGIAIGGRTNAPAYPTAVEAYNGSTWSTSPATLATGRGIGGYGPTGTSTAAVAFGGGPPGTGGLTEEYNKSVNVITAAAWASAPSIATGRYLLGSAGSTYNATVVFGGVTNPGSTYRAQTEEYNGTSWSEDGDMGTARFLPAKTIGTATAALAAGGYNGSTLSNSEQYNGSSWTAETAMPAANRNQSGFGIETAGVVAGGQGPAIWANVYKYDGSSWTTANALPVAKEQMCGTGTETAGLVVCGRPPSGNVTTVEEFDGTNWASGGAHPTAHAGNIVAGTQTDAYQFTGYDNSPAPFGITASYDGTSWRTMPSLGTNISSSGGSTGQGSGSSQIQGGGSTPSTPSSTTSQEFNTETTALNVKTLTQS